MITNVLTRCHFPDDFGMEIGSQAGVRFTEITSSLSSVNGAQALVILISDCYMFFMVELSDLAVSTTNKTFFPFATLLCFLCDDTLIAELIVHCAVRHRIENKVQNIGWKYFPMVFFRDFSQQLI